MKITKSEFKALIQEEVKRQKTIIELKNRKNAILKQLNEMEYVDMETETELEEGLFGPNLKSFTDDYNKFVSAYMAKGKKAPTPQEKEEIFKMAAADKYEGKMGFSPDGKKFTYRPSKDIKWNNPFAAGGTGGNPTGGTAGA